MSWRDNLEWGRERTGRDSPAKETPSAAVLGRKYVRLAEPYVRQLREECYGSPEPPFEALRGKITIPAEIVVGCNELAEATGFQKAAVRKWILTGETPRLHAVMIHVREQPLIRRADIKTGVITKRVVLELNAPVTEKEMRRVWYQVSSNFWSARGDPDAFIEGVRQPSFRAQDEELAELMERMPENADFTWTDRAAEWSKNHEPIGAGALRMRWRRLEEKRDRVLTRGEANAK